MSIIIKNKLAIFTGLDGKALVYNCGVLTRAEWRALANAIEGGRNYNVEHGGFGLLLLGDDMEVTDCRARKVYISAELAGTHSIRRYAGDDTCALFCAA